MPPSPIQIVTDEHVTCGALLYRRFDRDWLSIAVKATFSLVHDGPVTVLPPIDPVWEDQTFDGRPTRSVERAVDMVPFRSRCDVTLVGHAYAAGGQPAKAVSARLALFRDNVAVLDKTVHVFGDRDAAGQPTPFVKMPLTFERSSGGPGNDLNPVGSTNPNLVHPRDPRAPAAFGPTSRYWAFRKRLLPDLERKAVEGSPPALPSAMAPGYYQSAPLDQQVDSLRGDEWIVLDGMSPSRSRLQTRLTGARAGARMCRPTGEIATVDLTLDTLTIDADTERCSLVFRGSFEVKTPADLTGLFVCSGLEMAGRTIAWDRLAARARDLPSTANEPVQPVRPAPSNVGEGTMTLADDQPIAPRASAPFIIRAPGAQQVSPETSATPWGNLPIQPVAAQQGSTGEGTLPIGSLPISPVRPSAPFSAAAVPSVGENEAHARELKVLTTSLQQLGTPAADIERLTSALLPRVGTERS